MGKINAREQASYKKIARERRWGKEKG